MSGVQQSLSTEVADNANDDIGHSVKSFNHGLRRGDLRLGERNINQKMHTLVHLRFRDGAEYVARFQWHDDRRLREEVAGFGIDARRIDSQEILQASSL